jgi:antirestriction protein ArdC
MSFKHASREHAQRPDFMQELTNRVAEIIEQTGKLPWKREWDASKCAGPQGPVNAVTGEPYHGINTICLGLDIRALTSGDPRWATFNQAKDKGWHVKKGSKATTGVFYKPLEIDDEKADDGKKVIPLMKYFHVFPAIDIEGIPPYKPPTVEEAPWTRPDAVRTIMQNSGVQFRTGGDRAFYSAVMDLIQLPPDVAFPTPEYWCATAIHEINHSTGHPSRMNRDLTGRFGSEKYSMEESRVEMAAAFVCNALGLPTDFENHAAYVGGWLKKLREDKRELFHCAADAQKIADWTLRYHPDFAGKVEAHPDRPDATPGGAPQTSAHP